MSAVARRYAKALFALAKEGATLDPTLQELERIAAVARDPSVGPVLSSPLLSPARRRDLVQRIASDLRLSDLLTRFVALLADHQRLAELPRIHDHFQQLLDAELGRARISIRSARPLEAQQEAGLVATFSKLTGKQIVPNIVVDPELLGGVVVEVAGKVYDGSVRTQFHRLARQLAGAAL